MAVEPFSLHRVVYDLSSCLEASPGGLTLFPSNEVLAFFFPRLVFFPRFPFPLILLFFLSTGILPIEQLCVLLMWPVNRHPRLTFVMCRQAPDEEPPTQIPVYYIELE